ncbi:MAG: hypothetical protein WCJ07_09695, partial [Verrucomicrobiota bacterium]
MESQKRRTGAGISGQGPIYPRREPQSAAAKSFNADDPRDYKPKMFGARLKRANVKPAPCLLSC